MTDHRRVYCMEFEKKAQTSAAEIAKSYAAGANATPKPRGSKYEMLCCFSIFITALLFLLLYHAVTFD